MADEWQIDNEKNIKKLLQSRLLDFLLFYIKGKIFMKGFSKILKKCL